MDVGSLTIGELFQSTMTEFRRVKICKLGETVMCGSAIQLSCDKELLKGNTIIKLQRSSDSIEFQINYDKLINDDAFTMIKRLDGEVVASNVDLVYWDKPTFSANTTCDIDDTVNSLF